MAKKRTKAAQDNAGLNVDGMGMLGGQNAVQQSPVPGLPGVGNAPTHLGPMSKSFPYAGAASLGAGAGNEGPQNPYASSANISGAGLEDVQASINQLNQSNQMAFPAVNKYAAQDNSKDQRSSTGEDNGVSFTTRDEDHATGPAAWESLSKFMKTGDAKTDERAYRQSTRQGDRQQRQTDRMVAKGERKVDRIKPQGEQKPRGGDKPATPRTYRRVDRILARGDRKAARTKAQSERQVDRTFLKSLRGGLPVPPEIKPPAPGTWETAGIDKYVKTGQELPLMKEPDSGQVMEPWNPSMFNPAGYGSSLGRAKAEELQRQRYELKLKTDQLPPGIPGEPRNETGTFIQGQLQGQQPSPHPRNFGPGYNQAERRFGLRGLIPEPQNSKDIQGGSVTAPNAGSFLPESGTGGSIQGGSVTAPGAGSFLPDTTEKGSIDKYVKTGAEKQGYEKVAQRALTKYLKPTAAVAGGLGVLGGGAYMLRGPGGTPLVVNTTPPVVNTFGNPGRGRNLLSWDDTDITGDHATDEEFFERTGHRRDSEDDQRRADKGYAVDSLDPKSPAGKRRAADTKWREEQDPKSDGVPATPLHTDQARQETLKQDAEATGLTAKDDKGDWLGDHWPQLAVGAGALGLGGYGLYKYLNRDKDDEHAEEEEDEDSYVDDAKEAMSKYAKKEKKKEHPKDRELFATTPDGKKIYRQNWRWEYIDEHGTEREHADFVDEDGNKAEPFGVGTQIASSVMDKYGKSEQPADQTPRHDCHGVHPNQTHEEWKASLEKAALSKYAMQPADQRPRHDCNAVHPDMKHEEWVREEFNNPPTRDWEREKERRTDAAVKDYLLGKNKQYPLSKDRRWSYNRPGLKLYEGTAPKELGPPMPVPKKVSTGKASTYAVPSPSDRVSAGLSAHQPRRPFVTGKPGGSDGWWARAADFASVHIPQDAIKMLKEAGYAPFPCAFFGGLINSGLAVELLPNALEKAAGLVGNEFITELRAVNIPQLLEKVAVPKSVVTPKKPIKGGLGSRGSNVINIPVRPDPEVTKTLATGLFTPPKKLDVPEGPASLSSPEKVKPKVTPTTPEGPPIPSTQRQVINQRRGESPAAYNRRRVEAGYQEIDLGAGSVLTGQPEQLELFPNIGRRKPLEQTHGPRQPNPASQQAIDEVTGKPTPERQLKLDFGEDADAAELIRLQRAETLRLDAEEADSRAARNTAALQALGTSPVTPAVPEPRPGSLTRKVIGGTVGGGVTLLAGQEAYDKLTNSPGAIEAIAEKLGIDLEMVAELGDPETKLGKLFIAAKEGKIIEHIIETEGHDKVKAMLLDKMGAGGFNLLGGMGENINKFTKSIGMDSLLGMVMGPEAVANMSPILKLLMIAGGALGVGGLISGNTTAGMAGLAMFILPMVFGSLFGGAEKANANAPGAGAGAGAGADADADAGANASLMAQLDQYVLPDARSGSDTNSEYNITYYEMGRHAGFSKAQVDAYFKQRNEAAATAAEPEIGASTIPSEEVPGGTAEEPGAVPTAPPEEEDTAVPKPTTDTGIPIPVP